MDSQKLRPLVKETLAAADNDDGGNNIGFIIRKTAASHVPAGRVSINGWLISCRRVDDLTQSLAAEGRGQNPDSVMFDTADGDVPF